MLEEIEQEMFSGKVKTYRQKLNFVRISLYVAVAGLAAIYLSSLFGSSEMPLGDKPATYKIGSQMVMLTVVLLATFVSYKKPFVIFLLLSLFAIFMALAMTISIVSLVTYAPEGSEFVGFGTYWAMVGLYILCGILIAGALWGRKYEQMMKQTHQ